MQSFSSNHLTHISAAFSSQQWVKHRETLIFPAVVFIVVSDTRCKRFHTATPIQYDFIIQIVFQYDISCTDFV